MGCFNVHCHITGLPIVEGEEAAAVVSGREIDMFCSIFDGLISIETGIYDEYGWFQDREDRPKATEETNICIIYFKKSAWETISEFKFAANDACSIYSQLLMSFAIHKKGMQAMVKLARLAGETPKTVDIGVLNLPDSTLAEWIKVLSYCVANNINLATQYSSQGDSHMYNLSLIDLRIELQGAEWNRMKTDYNNTLESNENE